MTAISDRLHLLKTRFGGWAGLARATGVKAVTLRMAAERGSELTLATCGKVVTGTGCSRAWLERDEGEPFPKPAARRVAEAQEKYGKAPIMEIVFEIPLDLRPGQRIMGTVRLRTDKG